MPLSGPSSVSDREALFLSCLSTIDRVAGILGQRHGLAEADVEEFASWAKARLIDGDYAVFQKFEGRSSLNTYLAVVLANLFKDFRNSRWGRWRPSAAARRLGALAVRFETLVYRDGHSAHEAVELLRTQGADEEETKNLAFRVPPRSSVREVSIDAAAENAADPHGADLALRWREREAELVRSEDILRAALAELPSDEQVIVRMRFWDSFSVADIARALGQEQKPLYRKLEVIQRKLGVLLQAQGVDRNRVAALLATEGADE